MPTRIILSAIVSGRNSHNTAEHRAEIVMVGKAKLRRNLSNTLSALQKYCGVAHLHFVKIPCNAHTCVFGEYFFQIGQAHIAKPCNLLRAERFFQMLLQNAKDLGIPHGRRGFHNTLIGGTSHGAEQPAFQTQSLFVQLFCIRAVQAVAHLRADLQQFLLMSGLWSKYAPLILRHGG